MQYLVAESMGEMLPPLWSEGLTALRGNKRYLRPAFAPAHHPSDASNGNAGDAARHARGRWGGEHQLVVLAAVQCLFERCARMDGQCAGVDFCGDS